MHIYSKGWFIKQLNAIGVKSHPNGGHLGKYKAHELRKLYYDMILK
ncbi:hypothetical protein LC76P1_00174 [Lysinibacillus phage LC76P1]|nr:hypothetical protein LC76P1_00174 [Lysinibacillus phage LC76P1]